MIWVEFGEFETVCVDLNDATVYNNTLPPGNVNSAVPNPQNVTGFGFELGAYTPGSSPKECYDNNEKKLTCGRDGVEPTYDDLSNKSRAGKEFATLEPSRGHIQLRILVDKTSVEIYANNGEVFMPMGAVSKGGQDKSLELFAEGGTANIRSLAIRELKSVW